MLNTVGIKFRELNTLQKRPTEEEMKKPDAARDAIAEQFHAQCRVETAPEEYDDYAQENGELLPELREMTGDESIRRGSNDRERHAEIKLA